MKRTITCLHLIFIFLSSLLHAEEIKFIALGDMPYSIPKDITRFERLIKAINTEDPNFSVFVGDTKSGSTPCTTEYALKIKDYFNTFEKPLIYSIGDNEWTDCHRQKAGSFDPLERLSKVRDIYFQNNLSLGKSKIQLTRQSDTSNGYEKFVENSYWVMNNYLFVSLHIPGSNNNFERSLQAVSEYFERNRANITWIENVFSLATKNHYSGIVFFYQADMFYEPRLSFDLSSGYKDTIESFSKNSQAFKKPVLLVHGDSHRLIIDQPLKTVDKQHVLENVYRLQVMGDDQVQAVEVEINTNKNSPFSFRPMFVPENDAMLY